jgi:hypothetical protein
MCRVGRSCYQSVRMRHTAGCRCFTLLHALADKLAEADPRFDRSRFLLVAWNVFGERVEPVAGPDPRD